MREEFEHSKQQLAARAGAAEEVLYLHELILCHAHVVVRLFNSRGETYNLYLTKR